MHLNGKRIRLTKLHAKDTCWNSERNALLFDPERNEMNGKKMNIFKKKKITDFRQFFTNC